MSYKRIKKIEGQPQVDDVFRKLDQTGETPNRYKQVIVSPQSTPENNKQPSAKKRTPPSPPSAEREIIKKAHCDPHDSSADSIEVEPESMEPPPQPTPTPNKQESMDIDKKLDGFPEEYKAFGKALCEILLKNNESTMQDLIKPLKDDIKTLLDAKTDENTYEETLQEVKEDQNKLESRCNEIEIENKELRTRLNKLENQMLSNNLIMHGVREDAWELEDNRKEKIYNAIAHTVDEKDHRKRHEIARSIPISGTKRLGKYRAGSNRPISISFEKKTHATTLLQSRSYLPQGIFVDKEYSADTEKARKILRPFLKLAKTKEHYKGKCKLEEDNLVIQGKRYSTNDLKLLPPDLNSFDATSRTNSSTLGFFGELNPLSNFHPAKFHLNGKDYHSSEQYIQEIKALHFKDKKMAKDIMSSNSAIECKKLSANIIGYNHEEWKKVAKDVCKPGIAAKFGSSPELSKILKSTGKKTLVESCHDQFWGTGVPLGRKECLNRDKWSGIGTMGEILMDIRDNLLPNEETMESTESTV